MFSMFIRETMLQAAQQKRYRYPDDSDKLMHQLIYFWTIFSLKTFSRYAYNIDSSQNEINRISRITDMFINIWRFQGISYTTSTHNMFIHWTSVHTHKIAIPLNFLVSLSKASLSLLLAMQCIIITHMLVSSILQRGEQVSSLRPVHLRDEYRRLRVPL